MADERIWWQRTSVWTMSLAVMLTLAVIQPAWARSGRIPSLEGLVASDGVGLPGYHVTLYASYGGSHPRFDPLGSDKTDQRGRFRIHYFEVFGNDDSELGDNDHKRHNMSKPALFVIAKKGAVMLASAIGIGDSVPDKVVVNERTTVATANVAAQFIDRGEIEGNAYGLLNAVHMAANLASPETGAVGLILSSSPNGVETSTLATFNSLANVVAGCVADEKRCDRLFEATTPRAGRPPRNVLQALANLTKNPSYPGYPTNADDPIFLLSQLTPIYHPALIHRPTNWLLFLKITGEFRSAQDSDNLMNGPGNFAIDDKGFVWVNDNAVPQPPDEFACAGRRLLKFYPWGKTFPGSPYFGGGLSGAGYGITLDPLGRVWVGNFGFQDPPCAMRPVAAPHNSVSAFRPNGTPISHAGGFTNGDVLWPQGTVSDRKGNIWIANCGNDSVTKIPGGDHTRAFNIPLGATPPSNRPQMKPFGLAIDLDGNVWVNNNRSHTVSVVSPHGHVIDTIPGIYEGRTVLSHPVGNASDSEGNMWVANSDWLDSPCPTRTDLGSATNPTITMFQAKNRRPQPGSPFTGGGLTLPWGIAVDGDDMVWVFNFGAVKVGETTDIATGISRFCGAATRKCPKGMKTGDPISPDTGYRSDALERITGGQIDPSGNIWLTNNWKRDANPFLNPFGNAIVIAIGAAGPLKTPLIGPPISFR
ncbi:hypothetical protein W02_09510 [Nitrospira sp. KM1]|uniref:NHL repeat-containing protein n=1 Tax=Nitrospira sp. KM1 TaxID=1936990 RepID=UPI0013A76EB5|nr:NHL repeat-containing protein [Nitrospira sp. KM1]BCA53811.1 hypothetical protein W02_09510 [Nitrospira sp. KM1]